LDVRKIDRKKYSIEGYTESQYVRQCLAERDFEDWEDAEYLIFGDIIRKDKGVVVIPFLEDKARKQPIPLRSVYFGGAEIQDFPMRLADYLAEVLVIVIGQDELERRGYDLGQIDGVLGPRTREALQSYQMSNGLPITRNFDVRTLIALGLHT